MKRSASILILGLGLLGMAPGLVSPIVAQEPTTVESVQVIREYPETPRASWRSLEWEAVDGRPALEGLSVLEVAARGMVDRLLLLGRQVEWNTEVRLVSTVTVAPRNGEHEFFVQDDESGWWVELTLDYDHRWNGLRHYVRTVGDFLRSEDSLGFHLRTSDGIDIEGQVLPGEDGWVDEAALLAALDEIGVVARFGAAIPESLHRPLVGLRSYWESNDDGAGVTHETLIDLLALLNSPERDAAIREGKSRKADAEGGLVNTLFKPVRGAVGLWDDLWNRGDEESGEDGDGGEASTWKEEEGRPASGTEVADPGILAFLEKFKTIPSPDPLADHRLSDVLPGRTP